MFRWQKGSNSEVKLIEAPTAVDPEEQEHVEAHKLLGIWSLPSPGGDARVQGVGILPPLKKGSKPRTIPEGPTRSIQVCMSGPRSGEPWDWAAFLRQCPDVTLLLLSGDSEPKAILDRINREFADPGLAESRRQFLLDVLRYLNPSGGPLKDHTMVVWGPKDQVDEFRGFDGHVVRVNELGNLIQDVINGSRVSLETEMMDKVNGRLNAEVYGSPRYVKWESDYVGIPTTGWDYAYYSIAGLRPDRLDPLLQRGDLLLRVRRVTHSEEVPVPGEFSGNGKRQVTKTETRVYVFVTAVLRVRRESQKHEDFVAISRDLIKLGFAVKRLRGDDLRLAWKSFIPGSPSRLELLRHQVPNPLAFFGEIERSLGTVGIPDGTMILGRTQNGVGYLTDLVKMPSLFIEGPTKTGKSTLLAFVLAYTPNVIAFPMAAAPGEATERWVNAFKGTIIPLELPDARAILAEEMIMKEPDYSTELQVGAHTDPAKREVELQRQLFHEDRAYAAKICEQIFERCNQAGRLVGFPISFQSTCGNTLRNLNFYQAFLVELRKTWESWNRTHFDRAVLVFNDLQHLTSQSKNDPTLGGMPANVANDLSMTIAWWVSNGANNRTSMVLLSQHVSDIGDTYDHVTTHLRLGLDSATGERVGEVINPQRKELIIRLNVNLPQSVVNLFGRSDSGLA